MLKNLSWKLTELLYASYYLLGYYETQLGNVSRKKYELEWIVCEPWHDDWFPGYWFACVINVFGLICRTSSVGKLHCVCDANDLMNCMDMM